MCAVDVDHCLVLIFIIRQLTTLNCFCIVVGILGVKYRTNLDFMIYKTLFVLKGHRYNLKKKIYEIYFSVFNE